MKNKNTSSKMALIIAACFAMPLAATAQDGNLDLSFGTGGKVMTDIIYSDAANDVALQTDGKIVVVGIAGTTGSINNIAVARYNIDGSLDNTFGTYGKVTTLTNPANKDEAYGVAIQSDGKILVAGHSYNDTNYASLLLRYTIDGSLDNSFDTDGIVSTSLGAGDHLLQEVAVQSDGKILLAGSIMASGKSHFSILRYNNDGSMDNSFGTNGLVNISFDTLYDLCNSIAIQSDGKILMAGSSFHTMELGDFAVARINADGSMDNTFGTNGKVTTSIRTELDYASSIEIQADGKIVLAGSSSLNNDDIFALVRYNSDGTLDNTFDGDGIQTTDFELAMQRLVDMAIQVDGKIMTAAVFHTGNGGSPGHDFGLVRYNTNGSIDSTFGNEGMVRTDVDSFSDFCNAMVLQSDGKIVLVGQIQDENFLSDFGVVRYINNGSTSIQTKVKTENTISIYPNPNNGTFTIVTASETKNARVKTYNILGKVIYEDQIKFNNNQTTIKLKAASGIYLLELYDQEVLIGYQRILLQ